MAKRRKKGNETHILYVNNMIYVINRRNDFYFIIENNNDNKDYKIV